MCEKKKRRLCVISFEATGMPKGNAHRGQPQMYTVVLMDAFPLFERLPVFRKKYTLIIPHFAFKQ